MEQVLNKAEGDRSFFTAEAGLPPQKQMFAPSVRYPHPALTGRRFASPGRTTLPTGGHKREGLHRCCRAIEPYFGATIRVRSDISPSNEMTMSSPGCR